MATDEFVHEVKKIGEVQIYLTSEGKFGAIIDGKRVIRKSLIELERVLELPVEVMAIHWRWRDEPSVITITGFDRKSKKFRAKGSYSLVEGYRLSRYDENSLKRVEEIRSQIKQLEQEISAIKQSLSPFTIEGEKSDE